MKLGEICVRNNIIQYGDNNCKLFEIYGKFIPMNIMLKS